MNNITQDYSCYKSNKYTFWYCTRHNNGFLIKDDITSYVPSWHKMCHTDECSYKDWHQKGIIEYNFDSIIELEKVHTYYGCYGGGFNFIQYSMDVMDIDGVIEFDNNELIIAWFHKKNKAD